MKVIYKKVCNFLDLKKITWVSYALFAIMLIPVCYLSFINNPTADEYYYTLNTKEAWVTSHSIFEVLKGTWATLKSYYYGWQGTWFTISLNTLQPDIFWDQGYALVTFVMLFIWCGSTYIFMNKFLKDKMKYDKWSIRLITVIYFMLMISFIPKTQPAIYWNVGAVHYTIPFAMCQILGYWLLKYIEQYETKYLIRIAVFAACLGGANYQAALLALVLMVYFIVGDYLVQKNKKIFVLLIPIVLEIIGLIVSMAAPGNWVRGGEEFGFTVDKAIKTIMMCFVGSVRDALDYMKTYPLLYVGFIIIFLVVLYAVKEREETVSVKYSIIIILAAYCLHSAVHAPAIYAAVSTSGGVYNTNFLVFMMLMMTIVICVAEKLAMCMKKKNIVVWKNLCEKVVMPGFAICVLLLLVFRSDIKDTATWECIEYISSGQAADFKEQMIQFKELLTDESVQDVVLPSINDQQGPLLHMPATTDPEAWTNRTISRYFGKRSVVAIPRNEWEEIYQKAGN